jgi:parvulin-like peptidyl-prolyl isomerase
LRKYVADELIWRKAQKLEYDEDPDVRRRLDALFKQLVVEAFVGKEILGKIEVDPADLKTFHAANRARYDQKQAARLRILKVASEKTAGNLLDQLGKGTSFATLATQHSLDAATRADGGLLPRWVERGDDFLQAGDAAAISETVFALGKGQTSKPIAAGKYVYLVHIVDTRPAKSRPFDEIAEVVERDYRMMKMQTAYQELIAQELSAGDVELFVENLAKTK